MGSRKAPSTGAAFTTFFALPQLQATDCFWTFAFLWEAWLSVAIEPGRHLRQQLQCASPPTPELASAQKRTPMEKKR